MRAIAPNYWQDGIRVNAICPGIVKTNLVNPEGWAAFPSHLFIAPETIAAAVQTLIHPGTDGLVDARGKFIPARQAYGLAVEISGDKLYFREPVGFCDDGMRDIMSATEVENQDQAAGVQDG